MIYDRQLKGGCSARVRAEMVVSVSGRIQTENQLKMVDKYNATASEMKQRFAKVLGDVKCPHPLQRKMWLQVQNKHNNLPRTQNKLWNQSLLVSHCSNPDLSRFAAVRSVTCPIVTVVGTHLLSRKIRKILLLSSSLLPCPSLSFRCGKAEWQRF